jgi:hypothetical protein
MKTQLLPLLLALAACSGEDIAVEVDRPADQVADALAGLQAGSVSDIALYKTQVFKAREEADVVRFRFIAPKDGEHQFGTSEANLTFRLEALEPGRTRIEVDVDVPEMEAYSSGRNKVLSEQKVIDRLKSALDSYAAAVNGGGQSGPALAGIDGLLTSLALAMDRRSVENIVTSQYGAADFRELVDTGPAFGEPTDDTTEAGYGADEADDGGWGTQ